MENVFVISRDGSNVRLCSLYIDNMITTFLWWTLASHRGVEKPTIKSCANVTLLFVMRRWSLFQFHLHYTFWTQLPNVNFISISNSWSLMRKVPWGTSISPLELWKKCAIKNYWIRFSHDIMNKYKFTVVYCESVNLIGYIIVFYLLLVEFY